MHVFERTLVLTVIIKMLILTSQTMVDHPSVHPADPLFSSDPDKTETQLHFHVKPMMYPEGARNGPVLHKCL